MADTPTSSAAQAEEILGELEQAVKGIAEAPSPSIESDKDKIYVESMEQLEKETLTEIKKVVESYKRKVADAKIAELKKAGGLQ
jgi:hypothetical protein